MKTDLKTVRILIRSTTSRVPFRTGTFIATLEEADGAYDTLVTSRNHETWADAARPALYLADRRGYAVQNRSLVERRIKSEKP